MNISNDEVQQANSQLRHATPQEVLQWSLARFGSKLTVSTAFGAEGCALVDMAVRLDPAVDVFTVDTGFLFAETRELMTGFCRKYGLALRIVRPRLSVEEQGRRFGEQLYQRDADRCCAIRKVEPLQRALQGADAWVAGLRRDQSDTRARIDVVARFPLASGREIVKVHPFANWTREDVWRYILDNDVPYNPLLDQGFPSIGCWPCTTRVDAGAGERDGRWAGSAKTECGIHVTLPLRTASSQG